MSFLTAMLERAYAAMGLRQPRRFPFAVEKWRRWIAEAMEDDGDGSDPVPIDLVLKWIEMESGGNVCGVGRVGKPGEPYPGHVFEAGLAQTYFSTPNERRHGVTSAELRRRCSGTSMPQNLDDDDRRTQARVCLDTIQEARDIARARLVRAGVAWPERDFWCFVKLYHALPALYAFLAAAKRAGQATSWATFRAFILTATPDERGRISPVVPARYSTASLAHWLDTCETFASASP